MLRYEVTFPPMPTGADIVSQRFTASQNGNDEVQTLGVDATSAQFVVPDAAEVTISLVYIDDANNESPPRTQTFTAHDTIPPDAPGDFGTVELLGEE